MRRRCDLTGDVVASIEAKINKCLRIFFLGRKMLKVKLAFISKNLNLKMTWFIILACTWNLVMDSKRLLTCNFCILLDHKH